MEEHLRSLLLGDAAVSQQAGDRIDWGARPQGDVLPAMVMFVIDDIGSHNLRGPDGVFAARVQIDCYAGTYNATKQLSRAVRSFLDGYRDAELMGVFLAGARDGREGDLVADRPFRVSLDFMVHYSI